MRLPLHRRREFAEGDSRILMQKMARDRLRAYAKAQKAGLTPSAEDAEEVTGAGRANARAFLFVLFVLVRAARARGGVASEIASFSPDDKSA